MTWQYFSYDTDPMLSCPCCGEKGMDGETAVKLTNAQWDLISKKNEIDTYGDS